VDDVKSNATPSKNGSPAHASNGKGPQKKNEWEGKYGSTFPTLNGPRVLVQPSVKKSRFENMLHSKVLYAGEAGDKVV